jgi:hypothetical protein
MEVFTMSSQENIPEESGAEVPAGEENTSSRKSKTTEDPTARKLRLGREATDLMASLNDGVLSGLKHVPAHAKQRHFADTQILGALSLRSV